MKNSVGICTWSLKNDVDQVFRTLEESGLSCLHLDVSARNAFRDRLVEKGVVVTSTMVAFPQEDYSTLESIKQTGGIIPDDCWERNRRIVFDAIEATADLNVEYLSFHAGFMDHEDAVGFRKFCDRISELADVASEHGVVLLLETGQETADDLSHFLDVIEHPAIGVNFDPANMILYGKGNPIEAVHTLAPWIRHVHIKDAVASTDSCEWGTEVPWGDGEVGSADFMQVLCEIKYNGDLAIEREAGDQRRQDIIHAAKQLEVTA